MLKANYAITVLTYFPMSFLEGRILKTNNYCITLEQLCALKLNMKFFSTTTTINTNINIINKMKLHVIIIIITQNCTKMTDCDKQTIGVRMIT